MCKDYLSKLGPCKAIATLVIFGASWVTAYAGPFDTVKPYVSYSEAYESNILDLPSSAVAVQVLGSPSMSDVTRTEQIGVSVDDLIGLQHITADVSDSNVDFRRLSSLNYQAPNAKGNWNWNIQDDLTGNLGGSYSKSLAPFIYFHLPEKNLQVLKLANFDLAWHFHPSWRAVASVDMVQLSFALPSQQPYSRNEYHTLAGFDYVAADKSSVGIQVGNLRTYFPYPQLFGTEEIANNSSQDEFKLKVDWNFSDKTQFQFLGGWVDRKYNVLTNQNYSGWNERVGMVWTPTAKLYLNVMAWNEIGAVDGLTTVYAINHGISVTPAWIISEKMRLDAQFKVEKHTFNETPGVTSALVSGTGYTAHSDMLTYTYSPTSKWKIAASASHISQSTSDNSNSFAGYAINGNVRFQF